MLPTVRHIYLTVHGTVQGVSFISLFVDTHHIISAPKSRYVSRSNLCDLLSLRMIVASQFTYLCDFNMSTGFIHVIILRFFSMGILIMSLHLGVIY